MVAVKKTVAIVDDEPQVLDLTARILTRTLPGVRCVTHADAPHALEALATEPVDLLLVDVNLPGMPRAAFPHEFLKQHPSTRVLYITGEDGRDLPYSCLRKPYTIAELTATVRSLLD